MKQIVLTFIFICWTAIIFASDYKFVSSRVNSSEYSSLTGTFTFSVDFEIKKTTTFSRNLEFELPTGWTASSSQNVAENTYNQGQTFTINITVNYPVNNIPYYSQRIRILQFINEELSNETIGEVKEICSAMIYFTPYNTVEIWNPQEYHDLPRRWHLPAENNDTTRISFAKSFIPVSDLDTAYINNWYLQKILWDDEIEFKYVSVPGLGYDVIMMQTDTSGMGDGIDSLGNGQKKTFTGTVTGRLTAWVKNDIGQLWQIPVAGIKVRLREADIAWFETFGETYTDENGFFSISYSESQALEGDFVELFLEFKSKTNDTYKITSSNTWGNLFEVRTGQWSAPQTAGTMTQNYLFGLNVSDAEPFKSVHWVRRGFQYFTNNGISLHKNLRIKPFALGSWFEPSFIPPLFEPTIHLADGDGDRENTTYHEFGHATMHKLQGNNFTYPYGDNGLSHGWDEENTSRLAWVEGWANAIQMILDAAYWEEDGEYAMDEGHQNDPYFEERNHYSWQHLIPNYWGIVNGFRSEYYIACAIYDLWDGSGKGLPNTIPGTSIHGWNDSEQGNTGWASIDDVELSFYTICKPLMDHQTGNGGYLSNQRCMNIQDYYFYLLDLLGDCNLKSDISRCFRENRVLWNIPEYEWGWNITPISSDYIRQTKIKSEVGYLIMGSEYDFQIWQDDYLVNFSNDQIFNEFRYSAWPSKDLKISDPLWLGIWDNFASVYKQSDLYLNDEIRPDDTGMSSIHGDFETCGCIEIDIRNGKLELGGMETSAKLTINDCSTLRIRNNGSLVVNDNSMLIIECGANIIYEDGAIIELNGENAQLIIKGGLEVGGNAVFAFQGTGSLTKLGPSDIIIPHPNSSNSSFIVESGTSMTIIANNSIRLKHGFHSKAESHLRAYIDPNLPDCEAKSVNASNDDGNSNSSHVLTDNDNTSGRGLKWEPIDDTSTQKSQMKLQTRLIGNYPNPYTNKTTINYKIGEECPVKIFITDMNGIKISEILDKQTHEIGEYEIEYNSLELKAGIYFYTLQTDKYFQTRRMIKL